MSKFFKVFGNIDWSGEWGEPDPFFIGEILVDECGIAKGYCDCFPVGRSRYKKYLIGFISQGNENEVILFQISNECEGSTNIFINTNFISSENSIWASVPASSRLYYEDNPTLMSPKFITYGGARVRLEEAGISGANLFRVKKNLQGLTQNSQLIRRLTSSTEIYENILENSNHLFQKTA